MHLTCTPLPHEDVPLHTSDLIGKVCDSPGNDLWIWILRAYVCLLLKLFWYRATSLLAYFCKNTLSNQCSMLLKQLLMMKSIKIWLPWQKYAYHDNNNDQKLNLILNQLSIHHIQYWKWTGLHIEFSIQDYLHTMRNGTRDINCNIDS